MRTKTRGLRAEDIEPGTCGKAAIGGREIAVFNVDGKLYATQPNCTHWDGPLCEGSLSGEIVICPWHGSEFNVRTGEVVSGPAESPLKTYQISVEDGTISIDNA